MRVSGVADRFTDFLRTNNLDVVKSGNYISDDKRESVIIDRIWQIYLNGKSTGIKSENVIQQSIKIIFRCLNRDWQRLF